MPPQSLETDSPGIKLSEVSAALRCSLRLPPNAELDPDRAVSMLRTNQVPFLSLLPGSERSPDESLFRSPPFQRAVDEDRGLYAECHAEYLHLVKRWSTAGIQGICFKSAGIPPSLPYTSGNIDILLPDVRVWDARQILLELGYVELTNAEENFKWLFRRFDGGRSVSAIHLHAHVGWRESFMLEGELWRRARVSADDPFTWAPGPEDAVLINLSHALVENKALTLHDLIKVRYALAAGGIDWNYLHRVAGERGWNAILNLGLLVVATLEREYGLSPTVPEVEREHAEGALHEHRWAGRYWERLREKPPMLPFRISFSVSVALFFQKLWLDRHVPLAHKPLRALENFAGGLLQRSGLHPQNAMLVSLSGLDGSGKSRHAEALEAALRTSNLRSRLLWTRLGDTPCLHRLRLTRRACAGSGNGREQAPFTRRGRRLELWAVVASADFALWLQWVRWRLWRGDVVVTDRYLPDFDVELVARLASKPGLARRLARAARLAAPAPRLPYLLRIDAATAVDRIGAGGFAGLRPEELRQQYDAVSGSYELSVLDASRPFDEISNALVREVLTTYMSDFWQLARLPFGANPRGVYPGQPQAGVGKRLRSSDPRPPRR